METYNTKLQELMDRMTRQQKLKAVQADLQKQRNALQQKVQQLKNETYRESLDVEKLESFSITRLFYQLTGKLEEQLSKEDAELCAAALRYDAARKELEAVEQELAGYDSELASLQGCESEYARLLQEKASALKASGTPDGQRICALEETIARLTSEEREIQEAISAGNSALSDISAIQRDLSSAEGWGTWDLVGGGLISDLAKHSHLDDAQRRVSALQRSLSRFRTELADVSVQADLQVQVDGFLRFADYFFDGLFADWAVLDRIHNAQSQVNRVEQSVRSIQNRLIMMRSQCLEKKKALRKELDDIVLHAHG